MKHRIYDFLKLGYLSSSKKNIYYHYYYYYY